VIALDSLRSLEDRVTELDLRTSPCEDEKTSLHLARQNVYSEDRYDYQGISLQMMIVAAAAFLGSGFLMILPGAYLMHSSFKDWPYALCMLLTIGGMALNERLKNRRNELEERISLHEKTIGLQCPPLHEPTNSTFIWILRFALGMLALLQFLFFFFSTH
jgi:hypothetical protein